MFSEPQNERRTMSDDEKTSGYAEGRLPTTPGSSFKDEAAHWKMVVETLTAEANRMPDERRAPGADECASIAREAGELLRAWKRGLWGPDEADAADELIPSLMDERMDTLADKLIFAVERYRTNAAARWGREF